MPHRLMGRVHAGLTHTLHRLAEGERGQGTVEYVGLVLLVAGVLGAVVAVAGHAQGAGGIANSIVSHIKSAMGKVH
jgi:hypothetical protein